MIRDELPALAKLLDVISDIYHSTDYSDGFAFMQELGNPESEAARTMARLNLLREECGLLIAAHSISDATKERFVAAVNDDLNDVSMLGAKISIILSPGPGMRPSSDWFHRRAFGEGDALDSSICYSVSHPELLREAQGKWGTNPRLAFTKFDDENRKSVAALRSAESDILVEHGLPDDSLTWQWVLEAINAAQFGLQHLGMNFRLCDFVEWTCTGQRPNLYQGAIFGEPQLYALTGFGSRIHGDETLTRLEGCVIWKSAEGTYVSPLWEFLSWSNGSRIDEVSRYLGDIGGGIDAALLSFDPDVDPDDRHIARLAPSLIFRAGEAMIRLRVSLELGETVLKGKRADAAAKSRAVKGGAKSSEARSNRIASLLTHMEKLANDNPALVRVGPVALSALACDDAISANPALWAQGANQVSEYLGELRRGEAGHNFQARYLALFPTKPLKQFTGKVESA